MATRKDQSSSQAPQASQTSLESHMTHVTVNKNVYSSPYYSYDSDEFYCLPASPPPSREEQLRIKAEKDQYLENNVDYPNCESAQKYKITTKIGQGTFGEVFRGTLKTDETKVVAMKKILMQKEANGFPITALREIRILKLLSHTNIVNLIEIVQTKARARNEYKSTFYMIFEFCDHDLSGLLSNHSIKFHLSEIKEMMRQLFNGVYFMHYNKILHRDIKAANILITKNGVLKIADFGLARAYSEPLNENNPNKYTNCVVTIWYRPPELLLGERNYGPPIDIWGVGCIMAEMWTRTPILQGASEQGQLNLISQLCGSINSKVWPKVVTLSLFDNIELIKGQSRKVIDKLKPVIRDALACDLLDKLLVLDPERRLTADQALDHEFFWNEPYPSNLSKLMSSMNSNNLEYLVKTNQTNNLIRSRQGSFISNKSTLQTTGFPDHIF